MTLLIDLPIELLDQIAQEKTEARQFIFTCWIKKELACYNLFAFFGGQHVHTPNKKQDMYPIFFDNTLLTDVQESLTKITRSQLRTNGPYSISKGAQKVNLHNPNSQDNISKIFTLDS